MQANTNQTIKTLRVNGWKVSIQHFRAVSPDFGDRIPKILPDKLLRANPRLDVGTVSVKPLQKGGETHLELTSPNGRRFTGKAVASAKDNFCRKNGVRVALGRALKSVEKAGVGLLADLRELCTA